METTISATNLTKEFVSFKKEPGLAGAIKFFFKRQPIIKSAISDFDLKITKGEIVGLLGPNGAGKTTLMKMFTGIIVPSRGELKVLGHDPFKRQDEFKKKIALVMGQKSQLWWDIPAMDSFLLLQKYYEIPKLQFEQRLGQMARMLDVEKLLHVHVRRLSLGERMKLELISSLLHNPQILFLDEPTIGLDLVAQDTIRNFIKEYHRLNNCTIILTSHYMADVQALCKRLVLVFDGRKGFDGPIEEFEKILGPEQSVTVQFNTPAQDQTFFSSYDPQWSRESNQVDLRIPADQFKQVSIDIFKNFDVASFNCEKMPIEKVMKSLMKEKQLPEAQRN
jgi:ABC-2 type transport system ATP-binding protein